MLAEGLRETLVATGSPGNAIVLRKGSETEVQSGIERDLALAMMAPHCTTFSSATPSTSFFSL